MIYILENYSVTGGAVVYTVDSKEHAIRVLDNSYEGAPFNDMTGRDWIDELGYSTAAEMQADDDEHVRKLAGLILQHGIYKKYCKMHFDGSFALKESINIWEEWRNFAYSEHGALVHMYENISAIKEDLDDQKGWLTKECNLKARLLLEEWYNLETLLI